MENSLGGRRRPRACPTTRTSPHLSCFRKAPANELAPDSADQTSFFAVLKQAGGPIGEASIGDRITNAIRSFWRNPQAQPLVVTEAFQPRKIKAKLRFGKFGGEDVEDALFERNQMGLLRGRFD